MTDIERMHKCHGVQKEDSYEKFTEAEAKMLMKCYDENVTIEDYKKLYDEYSKIKKENKNNFDSYMNALQESKNNAKLYKEYKKHSKLSTFFTFASAYIASCVLIYILNDQVTFLGLYFQSLLMATISFIISSILKLPLFESEYFLGKEELPIAVYVILLILIPVVLRLIF